jgi:hypothetical protein
MKDRENVTVSLAVDSVRYTTSGKSFNEGNIFLLIAASWEKVRGS